MVFGVGVGVGVGVLVGFFDVLDELVEVDELEVGVPDFEPDLDVLEVGVEEDEGVLDVDGASGVTTGTGGAVTAPGLPIRCTLPSAPMTRNAGLFAGTMPRAAAAAARF